MSQLPSSPTFNGFAGSAGLTGGGNPLANIPTNLAFSPGGNPIAASGAGAAGLAVDYGSTYASALKANQQNYNNIVAGYGALAGNIGGILGQGGTGWGIAGPAAQAIADTQAQQTGGAIQNSINKGTGSTTAAVAAQRGANFDAQKAYAGLGAQLGQTYAGYASGLGQGLLGFMGSVSAPYPNAAGYNQILAQQGAFAQANADRQRLLNFRGFPQGGSGGGVQGLGSAGLTNTSKFNAGLGGGGGGGGLGGGLDPGAGPVSGGGYSFADTLGGGYQPYTGPMAYQQQNAQIFGGSPLGIQSYGGGLGGGSDLVSGADFSQGFGTGF